MEIRHRIQGCQLYEAKVRFTCLALRKITGLSFYDLTPEKLLANPI